MSVWYIKGLILNYSLGCINTNLCINPCSSCMKGMEWLHVQCSGFSSSSSATWHMDRNKSAVFPPPPSQFIPFNSCRCLNSSECFFAQIHTNNTEWMGSKGLKKWLIHFHDIVRKEREEKNTCRDNIIHEDDDTHLKLEYDSLEWSLDKVCRENSKHFWLKEGKKTNKIKSLRKFLQLNMYYDLVHSNVLRKIQSLL